MAVYDFDWFTAKIPHWQELLSEFIGQPHLQFLEIGSFEGLSACWLMDNVLTASTSRLTCVDPWEPYATLGKVDFGKVEQHFDDNVRPYGDRIQKVKSYSLPFLLHQACTQSEPIYHCVYIDGDHHAHNVLQDAVLSFLLLRVGSIMIFDDYKWRRRATVMVPPKPAIDSFLCAYTDRLELLHSGKQVFVRKTDPSEGWRTRRGSG